MPHGVSQRRFAEMIGVTETAVRKAAKAGRISKLADGSIDPVAARAAWEGATDPARTRVRTQPRTQPEVRIPGSQGGSRRPVPVLTEADAREAIGLIARVLASEGVEAGGPIDSGKARTAELILKARQRDLDQAEQSRRLVDRGAAEAAFFEEARTIRDSLLSWPARVAIEMAEEIRVDPATGKVDFRSLTMVLGAQVRKLLAEMGEPEIPHWKAA